MLEPDCNWNELVQFVHTLDRKEIVSIKGYVIVALGCYERIAKSFLINGNVWIRIK
jgi:hypothetical protein